MCTECLLSLRFVVLDRLERPDATIATGEAYLAQKRPGAAFNESLKLAGVQQRLGELYEAKGSPYFLAVIAFDRKIAQLRAGAFYGAARTVRQLRKRAATGDDNRGSRRYGQRFAEFPANVFPWSVLPAVGPCSAQLFAEGCCHG